MSQVPPNTSGLVPREFVEAVSGLGSAVRASFDSDLGHLATPAHGSCATLEVLVSATGPFDAVLLQEDLSKGQTILGYRLELG